MEHYGQGEERKDTERQIDVEDPPPGEIVRDPTPHRRTDDAGEREDAEEDALVFRPACGVGEDICNAGEDVGEDHACSESLQAPEKYQLGHAPGRPTERA